MQLIERYIEAVKFWLPTAQQADIAAELRANLLAQAEDKEAELGRALDEKEEAQIIKQFGPPAVVAARYREDQGTVALGPQVIGPLVFPYYWLAVKTTLWILAILASVTAAAQALQDDGNVTQLVIQALARLPVLALPALVLVTLVFVGIDYGLQKYRPFENWDPRSLPPLRRRQQNVPRSNSIGGIVIQLVFIIWWLGLPSFPDLILGEMRPAPVWQSLYFPVLLIAVAHLAQNVATLVRPHWVWVPPAVSLLTSIATLIILYPLVHNDSLAVLGGEDRSALSDLKASKLNRGLHWAVLMTWIGVLIAALVDGARCIRLGRDLFGHTTPPSAKGVVNGGAH